MKRRMLGSTSLDVSILGFGASPLGDVFARTDPFEGTRAVHLAIDRGINFFDVSPYYGLTLAEERLGAALDGKRNEVVLATKVGRYGADVFDFSRAGIRSGLEASLRRLKTDHVDLLQAHDVEFGSAQQIIDETLPAMVELQREGKTRYIGITGYLPGMLVRLAEVVRVDTILSYCRYNLLFTDMNELLTPFTEEHRIGLINASPLAMGLLTEKGPPDWHPAPAGLRRAAARICATCRIHGVDVATLALQFCLANIRVSSTLVGMSTVAEVEANLVAAAVDPDGDLLSEVRSDLDPQILKHWPSGRPDNQDLLPMRRPYSVTAT